MRYLILDNLTAEALNRKVTRANGAGTPEHVTQFWFSARDADDGQTMLEIPSDQERHLTDVERTALVQDVPVKFRRNDD